MQKIYILLILILTIPFVSLAQTAEKALESGNAKAILGDFNKPV